MGTVTIFILKTLIAVSLIGSLGVQLLLLPLVWADLAGVPMVARVALVALAAIFVLTLQVSAVCIWRLLTMVPVAARSSRRGPSATSTRSSAPWPSRPSRSSCSQSCSPQALAAPGLIGLLCGAALVTAGGALLMVVMRMLLRLATQREAEALSLRGELDEVI